jgi:hypothetical protein
MPLIVPLMNLSNGFPMDSSNEAEAFNDPTDIFKWFMRERERERDRQIER